jgi:hypothetical protein
MKTIYTAIFGDYDDLKEPLDASYVKGWKMICFTNQDITSKHWTIHKVPLMPCGPTKTARYYKIMFHKHIETEFSMWIDATFFINTDLNEWWNGRFLPSFTTIQHPFDDCIYQEATNCINGGKDDFRVIREQIRQYKHIGLPFSNGLIASGILMRQNTPEVRDICMTWWDQVQSQSCRDQISFGYAQWKHQGVHQSIKWDYTTQKEFIHVPHKSKPWRNKILQEIRDSYATTKR